MRDRKERNAKGRQREEKKSASEDVKIASHGYYQFSRFPDAGRANSPATQQCSGSVRVGQKYAPHLSCTVWGAQFRLTRFMGRLG